MLGASEVLIGIWLRIREGSAVCAGRENMSRWFVWICLLVASLAEAKKGAESGKQVESAVIEEVTAKQLERILQDKDFVAVFWCK